MSARFKTGDRVVVRTDNPPGHVRTPTYLRGKRGVILRDFGPWPNPEQLAYRQARLAAQDQLLGAVRHGRGLGRQRHLRQGRHRRRRDLRALAGAGHGTRERAHDPRQSRPRPSRPSTRSRPCARPRPPHDHGPFQPDIKEPSEDWEILEIALRELMIEKEIITAREIPRRSRSGTASARRSARASSPRRGPIRRSRRGLLADGNAAWASSASRCRASSWSCSRIRPRLHHMIVCTLCSCYPRTILGLPPLWYKSREYRSRAVREPRAVLAEFGTELPDRVEVRVVDSTADCRYLVLPRRPRRHRRLERGATRRS